MKLTTLQWTILAVVVLLAIMNWPRIKPALGLAPKNADDAPGTDKKFIEGIKGFFQAPDDVEGAIVCNKELKINNSKPQKAEVAILQRMLADCGMLTMNDVDGIFGKVTQKALVKATGRYTISLEKACNILNTKVQNITGTNPGYACTPTMTYFQK